MKPYKTIEDYKEKQELKIEKIVKEYSGYVYTVIKNFSTQNLSQEDIEEIIADTFFIVWKNQTKLEDELKISSYLVGIVKNLLREKTRKIRKTQIDKNLEDFESVLTNAKDLYEIYEEQEKIRVIQNTLQIMSDEENKIFKLFYYCRKKR